MSAPKFMEPTLSEPLVIFEAPGRRVHPVILGFLAVGSTGVAKSSGTLDLMLGSDRAAVDVHGTWSIRSVRAAGAIKEGRGKRRRKPQATQGPRSAQHMSTCELLLYMRARRRPVQPSKSTKSNERERGAAPMADGRKSVGKAAILPSIFYTYTDKKSK